MNNKYIISPTGRQGMAARFLVGDDLEAAPTYRCPPNSNDIKTEKASLK
jgi:hypothetical protein